jgi:imidazolonepropionase-like amidohydrolase
MQLGLPILPPGISLHTEPALLHRIGLTSRQAIATATGNFWEKIGWRDVGDLSAGSRADLLILDKKPADDLTNLKSITGLYVNGEAVDRSELLRLPRPQGGIPKP